MIKLKSLTSVEECIFSFCIYTAFMLNINCLYAKDPITNLDTILSKIKRGNQDINETTIQNLKENRQKMISRIEKFVSKSIGKIKEMKPQWSDKYFLTYSSATDAILLLGDLRAESSVPFLINHIDFRRVVKLNSGGPFSNYPCARALTMIGKKSTIGILDKLQSEKKLKKKKIKLFAEILFFIEGKKAALFLTEKRKRKSKNDYGKKNFNMVIKRLKNLDDYLTSEERFRQKFRQNNVDRTEGSSHEKK